ncbi:MAG TPA: tRNA (adenosine(37)-N6)-threonylcarbamoyltransferase complex ATPase subunit type 1 TsaE [Patescibacteria group bacterium]|nr:tRNA (adenosine(37)-N6)-threonylcarbamoyltransferase complex ATPase subunit type 1 TsaE [Patescibacteria group bacterium]
MQKFTSKSRKQTQKIASDFAKKLKGGEILCLYGNLGTGKTTFIQALAKALGVKENVTSPTFVLMKQYRIMNKKSRIKNFYHLDVYRLTEPEQALDLGVEEIWSDPHNIIAIEWADKISEILPEKKIDLCFESLDENKRKITIF